MSFKLSKLQIKNHEQGSDFIQEPQNNTSFHKQKQISQFQATYLRQIGEIYNFQRIKKLKTELKENHIIIDENNFKRTLDFEIIDTDFQSFTILLHYGIYKLKINLLMTELTDSYFGSQPLSTGSFGNIYTVQNLYAVKRILLKQAYLDQGLLDVYKQYLLCSIASILKVGPKVQKIFGYDIIVTKNSAFFAMELCQNYTKIQENEIERQSIENLRVLHSLKFMHLDIKPPNIAYSVFYEKCVFIDFGLSLLIKNEVGYKTYSNFAGTLSYCSEEMKKNYYTQRENLIDLYYNDLVSLKKSLRKITNNSQSSKKLFKDTTKQQVIFYEFQKRVNIVQQSKLAILNKFHIYLNNPQQIVQILPKLANMPKCFFTILNSKTTQRFILKNQKIKDQITKLSCKINQMQNNENTTDIIISEGLEKTKQSIDGVYYFKLSEQMLNLPRQTFKLLLQSQRFIFKIILYLDEFSKEEIKNQLKETKVLNLIKKVCEANKNQSPMETYQQVGYFLTYLNQKLIKNRSFKVLNIMRMLFIKIEDFKSIEPLEDEIVKMAATPTLKCLKIIQFLLFWSILFDTLKYYKINQWKKTIEELQSEEPLFTKIKQFSLTLLEIINDRFYDTGFVQNFQKKIQQWKEDLPTKQFKEQILIIKVLYRSFYHIQKNNFPNNRLINIYSIYFPSVKYSKTSEQETSFDNLFSSSIKYLSKYNFLSIRQKNGSKFENIIKYTFKRFQGRPDLINERFLENLQKSIQKKSLIFLFLNQYSQNLKILCEKFQYFCEFQVSSCQKNILRLFLLIKQNKYYSMKLPSENLSKKELTAILQNVKQIIDLCNQKIKNENKNILKKNSDRKIQRLIKIIYKIFINQINDIEQEVQSIYSSINYQNYDYNQERILFIVCFILEQLLKILPQHKKKFAEDLLLQICSSSIKSQNFVLFQNQILIISHYLRINFMRNQGQKNRIFTQKFLLYIEKNNIQYVKYFSENSVAYLCLTFCAFASPYQLKLIYQQISFKKDELQRKCYPFYLLSIFKELYPKWHQEREIMIRQLKRSCICIKNMFNLHALKAKKIILNYCRLPMIVKSERKRLICERMEMRNLFLEDFIRWDSLLIKSLGNRVRNNRIKQRIFQLTIFHKNYDQNLKRF